MRRFPRRLAAVSLAALVAAPAAHAATPTTRRDVTPPSTTALIYQGPLPGVTTVAPRKLGDFVAATPFLSMLAKAVDKAGLKGELNKAGPYTLFAPDDAAWARVPKAKLDELFADKTRLRAVLRHHVVKGRVDALTLIMQNPVLEGLDGKAVRVVKKTGVRGVRVDGALLIGSNMVASNGLVHIVDTVIGVGVPPVASSTTVVKGPTTLPASTNPTR